MLLQHSLYGISLILRSVGREGGGAIGGVGGWGGERKGGGTNERVSEGISGCYLNKKNRS